MAKQATYKEAGVDIDAANEAVERLKKHVKSTYTDNVLSDVGSFGGLYQFDKENVLVSSTDGVGTKLKLAFKTGIHHTVGQDLVNHHVNDILVLGASPMFFLDYIGCGKVVPKVIEELLRGLSIACRQNGCALVKGEIAEMPGLYKIDEYDLAGFIVGKVKRRDIVDGKKIKAGDIAIGLESSGLHTNGYSLALKVLLEDANLDLNSMPKGLNCTLREALMSVHRCYLKPVSEIMGKYNIKGMAHITGGGLVENIPRILPEGISVKINRESWKTPRIFELIQKLGNVAEDEMHRVFNMGIGYVIIVDKEDASEVMKILSRYDFKSHIIGEAVSGDRGVEF